MNFTEEFKNYVHNHFVKAKESALTTSMHIQKSELNMGHGYYTRTLFIPKIFSQEDKKLFEDIITMMFSIFDRVVDAYRTNPQIRQLFPFDERLEKLILLKPMYPNPIPIARIDIFFNEETKAFKFCEFNSDGTSAMNENARIHEFLKYNPAVEEIVPETESLELVNNWVKAFMADYDASDKKDEKPVIAITDFLEKAYLPELYVFADVFNQHGFECDVVDIRDFVYENGQLFCPKTGRTYNAIYRRAVTSDVMHDFDQIQPFIQAVEEEAVVLIGPFISQLIHHKDIFPILYNPLMQTYLNAEQIAFIQAHIPQTWDLTPAMAAIAAQDKDAYIIKPKDSYGAKGVFAGVDVSQKEWEKLLKDFEASDYILQEYVTPYKTENIDLINHDEFMPYSNLTGLYAYNGKFAGVYSRLSDAGIISSQYNEKMVPTLFLKD